MIAGTTEPDPVTCQLVTPAGQSFHLFSEISQHLLNGLDIHVPRRINDNDFCDVSSTNGRLTFVVLVKWLNNYWIDCREIWFRHSCSPRRILMTLMIFHLVPLKRRMRASSNLAG